MKNVYDQMKTAYDKINGMMIPNSVTDQIWVRIWSEMSVQVRNEVSGCQMKSVHNLIMNQIEQFRDQALDQVETLIFDQIVERSWGRMTYLQVETLIFDQIMERSWGRMTYLVRTNIRDQFYEKS